MKKIVKVIKQIFCGHSWKDVTSDINRSGGNAFWQCYKCRKIIQAYIPGVYHGSVWSAKVDEKLYEENTTKK